MILKLYYEKVVASSFPICIPLTSLCCLIAQARISSIILKRYGERWQLCLVPDFSRIASISLHLV